MSTTYQDFNRALVKDIRAHGKATSGPFLGRDVLVLTTKGAKSGDVRETPLVYTRDGNHYVIVASKGGAPTHPSWYHNLVKHRGAEIEVGTEKFKVRATALPKGPERDRLYEAHGETFAAFKDYPRKTTRVIPIVVLERVPPSTRRDVTA